jgi:hypothetical protein
LSDNKRIENHILKTELLDISELTPLQGNLKKLSDANFNKLRDSLIEKGFQFTVHVWESGGVTYIIDGHQRVHVLQQLRKSGWDIPPITCAFVKADNYHEAKELILYAISQYGKIDKQGFDEFTLNEDFDLISFDLPDFKIDVPSLDDLSDDNSEGIEPPKEEFLIVVTCNDESHQKSLFDQLMEQGESCKIM